MTPAGSISITNAFVVNGSDVALNNLKAGQEISIHADFNTTSLPSNASYEIAYDVNGITLDSSVVTYGAGGSGTSSWYYHLGNFIASPGTNQVIVSIVPQSPGKGAAAGYTTNTFAFSFTAALPAVSDLSYTVSQIRAAYAINSIHDFGTATPDGSGQTIAIVDEYNDPTIFSDLDDFDQAMNLSSNTSPTLYQVYGPASSFLTVYNQNGVNISSQIANSGVGAVPPVDPTEDTEIETTMDVQWAHAIAPGAKIDVVETDGSGPQGDFFKGAATAAHLAKVTVVSMSYIWDESDWSSSNGAGELAYDSSIFATPSGHPGITFLAANGDGGTPGGYPAFSPNVIAVGASQLTMNGDSYGGETAWSFPTPTTLDNGSGTYWQTGSWAAHSGGFSGSYSKAAGGSNSRATWTATLSNADYGWGDGSELSATWAPSPHNATNATYRIYDGTAATGTLLGTVTVDQTRAPVGTPDGNAEFQELGDYYSQTGTLTVVLSAKSANGTVVADAVGVAPAWATAGGQSQYEAEPAYQLGVQTTGKRTTPDVLFNGSDSSGGYCFENGAVGFDYFGTSIATPCWAGLIAIADQGRVAAGLPTLNSPGDPTQALEALYSLPSIDFHQITAGYNGLTPGPGYNEVTGLGSPIANLVVPALVSYGVNDQLAITANAPAQVTAGTPFGLTVALENQDGRVVGDDFTTPVTVTLRAGTGPLLGATTVTASRGIAAFTSLYDNTAGPIILMITAPGFEKADPGPITVVASAASKLVISASATQVHSGIPFAIAVTATDQFNNVAASYRGTIHFTASGTLHVLPANYTFTSGDAGTHKYVNGATLWAPPTVWTIKAFDVGRPSIAGSRFVVVIGSGPAASVATGGLGGAIGDRARSVAAPLARRSKPTVVRVPTAYAIPATASRSRINQAEARRVRVHAGP
jgi:subtilase family serine protease